MCSEDYQRESLALLKKIADAQETASVVDQYYAVSATQGFFLDFKKRRHLYLFSPTALVLVLPDIGATLAITANTWNEISYHPGLQIFTTSATSTPVLVLVRATDETLDSITAIAGSVTVANANANGQATMANGAPIAIASDQSPVASKAALSAYVDGAIVTIGTKADAAVIDPTLAASVIAILKGMQTELIDIETQTAIPAWTSIYTTTQTNVTTWAGSGNINGLGIYRSLAVNINITAITSGTIQFVLARRDSFGNFIFVKQTAALAVTGSALLDIGDALTGYFLSTALLIVNVSALVGCTFTVDVEAR